jgi:competence protein ComEC
VDLRLFGLAAGVWGSALAALFLSPAVAAGVAVVAAVAAVALLARRPHGARAAVAVVLLGVVCGAAATAARTWPRDAEPLASLAQERAQVRAALTVTDDPHRLHTGAGPPSYLVPATLTRVETDDLAVRLDVRVLVFATDEAWLTVLPGEEIGTDGRLAAPDGGDLTAATLRADAPRRLDRPPWMQRAAGSLRAGLRTASAPLPPEPGGLLPGLVVGDTSRLDPALADDFKATGMTHLVAVSGANLAVILAVVLLVCRWCRLPPWATALVCALAVVGFVILARPSPSVVRAAAMGAIGLVALATGRPRAAAPALAAAVAILVVVDPALAVDAGFALSVLATGGLVLLAPRWRDALLARRVPAGLAEALAVPAAAQVACAPVIAGLSGTVSAVAVPANLLAAPAVAPATLLGVGAAVVSPVWPSGAQLLAWLASWPARWLVLIAHTGARLPAGTLPWPGGVAGALLLAAVSAGLLLVLRRRLPQRLVAVIAVAAVLGAVPVRILAPGWPPTESVVVACDVGQGDAIALPAGVGRAVLVDTGPDPVAVGGCLRDLGVRAVPLLVLTHFHADHIGGLVGVLAGWPVGAIVVPRSGQPPPAAAQVRAAAEARGVPLIAPDPGWTEAWPRLTVTVLGPVRALSGTRSDPNNNSLILRANADGVSVLLAGDAEVEEQQELVTATDPALLRADVLKVAHHGSAYQDQEFLDLVRPRVALVSVGAGNDYGHPSEPVLARLAAAGARVLRTDRSGDVAVVRVGAGLGVVVHGSSAGRVAKETTIGHWWTVPAPRPVVQGWAGDPRPRRPAATRRWRRGTARGAGHRRGGDRGPGGGSGRVGDRARGRRHDRRRPLHGGEPITLRWSPGRGGPSGAGREEGTGRGAPRLREGARSRGEPRVRARGRGEGQGARGRAA